MSVLQSLREYAIESLEQARSLPFASYTDAEVFEAEATKIFRDEWVFVCMEGECASPGDYFATHIAGEPVVVVRGDDEVLRAFSNTCRHRGTPLLDDGRGTVKRQIICPYHAWTYSLSGSLKAVPFNKNIPVDSDEHGLISVRLEVWLGLVFVHLGQSPGSLADRLDGINKYLRIFEPEKFDCVASGNTETWQANWKLAIENAIESYHLFKVHRETLERYTPTRGAYYIAGSSEWSLTGGETKSEQGIVSKLIGSTYDDIYNHYILISVPPSFVGILSYGSLGWLSAHPIDPGRTRIRSGTVGLSDYMGEDQMTREFTEAFFAEDKWICERVQSGMYATTGRGGKLVDMEQVVVDFHQFLATRLFGLPAVEFSEGAGAAKFRD